MYVRDVSLHHCPTLPHYPRPYRPVSDPHCHQCPHSRDLGILRRHRQIGTECRRSDSIFGLRGDDCSCICIPESRQVIVMKHMLVDLLCENG